MLIGSRDIEEIFILTNKIKSPLDLYVDLRSRRIPNSDPDNLWGISHQNSDFEILNKNSIKKASVLSKEYKKELIAISLYCGACYPQDREYGLKAIEKASELSDVVLNNTLILRFLGGNVQTIEQKKYAIKTIKYWLEHSQKIYSKNGMKIIISIELHQGQWPETINEALELKKYLKKETSNYNLFGFIEDPANRYIALEDLQAFDNKKIFRLAGDIVYYHIKNVKKIGNTDVSTFNFQKLGDKYFNFRKSIFQWSDTPLKGDINLEKTILETFSKYNKKTMGFSIEHLPSTKNQNEAKKIAEDYISCINGIITKIRGNND